MIRTSWILIGIALMTACSADVSTPENSSNGVVHLSDLADCATGQMIQKTETGWACAPMDKANSNGALDIQAGEGIRVQSLDSGSQVSVKFPTEQGEAQGEATSAARSDHKTRWVDILSVPQQIRALGSLQNDTCSGGNLLKRTPNNDGWQCHNDALEIAEEACSAGELLVRNTNDTGWECQAPERAASIPTCPTNQEIKPAPSGEEWECVDKKLKTSVFWAGGNCWEVDPNAAGNDQDPKVQSLSTVLNHTKKSCDTKEVSLTPTSTVRVFLNDIPDRITITEWGMWVGLVASSDDQVPYWQCSLCRGHKESSTMAGCIEESIQWTNFPEAYNWEYMIKSSSLNHTVDQYAGFELLGVTHMPGWTVICEPRCVGDSCSAPPTRHLIHSVYLRYYDN